jgi:hypothetical protein
MITPLNDVHITRGPSDWPIDPATRLRIDAHWWDLLSANPRLWNGQVFGTLAPGWPGGIKVTDGVLTATAVEGDYASYLAWRDWGFPEIGIRNLFGSALILSSDGALIYGVMGGHTANAGKIYPPGGNLEPRDVRPDGVVDVVRSIELELEEETGLRARDAEIQGLLLCVDGPRVAIGRVFRFDEPADRLVARIRATLAADPNPELADVMALRRAGDLDPEISLPYAVAFLTHLTKAAADLEIGSI